MVLSHRGFLGAAILLLSVTVAAALPKGFLSNGPEDADTSFILDSRGGVEIFQGALPDKELLKRHEILKENFVQKEKVSMRAEMDGQESPLIPGSNYQVAYEIHAPSTGDKKSFIENRQEDGTVTGQYTVVEADGSLRVVRYRATPEEGFKAIVERKAVDGRYKPSLPTTGQVINADRVPSIVDVGQLINVNQLTSIPDGNEVIHVNSVSTIPEASELINVISLPSVPGVGEMNNADSLGTYDDLNGQILARNFNLGPENIESHVRAESNKSPSYYSGFRSGFSKPFEVGNDKHVETNSYFHMNNNVISNKLEGNQLGQTKEIMGNLFDENKMRFDGQFGAKMTHHKNQQGVSNHQQNMLKPQYSMHIQDNMHVQPFNSQNIVKGDEYSSHIQDNGNHQQVYQLIPVSIIKDSSKLFRFDGSLSPVYSINPNVENNYKLLNRKPITYTVLPVFLRRLP